MLKQPIKLLPNPYRNKEVILDYYKSINYIDMETFIYIFNRKIKLLRVRVLKTKYHRFIMLTQSGFTSWRI